MAANKYYDFTQTCIIAQPDGAKKLPNCALRGKRTKLGTMIVLDGLIIFSYGPHPNTHGGEAQWVLGGRGLAVCSKVRLYGEKIVNLGGKAPNLAW